MTDSVIQWTSIVIELFGLALVAIELYLPKLSERLKLTFEQTQPRVKNNPLLWISAFIVVWIVTVILLSLIDTAMSFYGNLIFTVVTVLVLFIHGISKLAIRLGVILGRGNAVGGVGLVLAISGLLLEILPLGGVI